MSQKKIPAEAFDAYVAMGESRSYQRVAEIYRCSKQAVTVRANREKWQTRLAELHAKARVERDQRAQQTLAELSLHHLKLWEVVERRALEGLRSFPITSAMDAVKALDLATKNIRLIRGEPTERTESIEAVIKREFDQFLTDRPTDGWEEPVDAEHEEIGDDESGDDDTALISDEGEREPVEGESVEGGDGTSG